jgi:GNAT superfamily N-acetyltransferase
VVATPPTDDDARAGSARALIDTMRVLSDALGRTVPIAPGVDYYSSGAWLPTMNGIVLDRERLGSAVPELDLGLVPTTMPWTIQVVGEDPDGALDRLARQHRPNRYTTTTWYGSLADAAPHFDAVDVDVERVADEQTRRQFLEVLASAAEGDNSALGAPEVLAHPGVRAYVAGGGDSVGMSVIDERGWLGGYAVATRPDRRRRGLARAVSRRILLDGLAAGAHTAVLTASPAALPLYQELGAKQSGHDIAYYAP